MSLIDDIENIKRQQDKLKARYEQLVARENNVKRKRRDRQCFIIGAWVISKQPHLAAAISNELTRDQDRVAFGLQPLPKPDSDLSAFRKVDIVLPVGEEGMSPSSPT